MKLWIPSSSRVFVVVVHEKDTEGKRKRQVRRINKKRMKQVENTIEVIA